MSMLEWTRQAVKRGYAALLLDSFGERDVDTVCMGAKMGVNFARGARDALQGAEHLRKFDFVDGKRIAHVGFSWGAMLSLLADSWPYQSYLNAGDSFTAHVSFYPGCFTIDFRDGPSVRVRATQHSTCTSCTDGRQRQRDTGPRMREPNCRMPRLKARRLSGMSIPTRRIAGTARISTAVPRSTFAAIMSFTATMRRSLSTLRRGCLNFSMGRGAETDVWQVSTNRANVRTLGSFVEEIRRSRSLQASRSVVLPHHAEGRAPPHGAREGSSQKD